MSSDVDQSLYARQLLLPELGLPGQQRLAASELQLADGAEPRAAAVATDYLLRAGVGSAGETLEPALPSSRELQAFAGDPALEECAAWLLGAFAAVEAIKQRCGAGAPASFAADFVLARELG